MEPETPDFSNASSEALIAPDSYDAKGRTVEAIAATTRYVSRGGGLMVQYPCTAEAVDLSRLTKGGVPFVDSHLWWQGAKAVLGTVLSAVIAGDQLRVKIKFHDTPEAREMEARILRGEVTRLSVGIGDAEYEKIEEPLDAAGTVRYAAKRWELLEVSAVAVPANPEAVFLSQGAMIVPITPETEKPAVAAELREFADAELSASPMDGPEAIRRNERERVRGIELAARTLGLSAHASALIDAGVSLDDARAKLLEMYEPKAEQPARPVATIVRDEVDTFRAGISDALSAATGVKLNAEENSRAAEFRRMAQRKSIQAIARESLARRGFRDAHALGADELSRIALGREAVGHVSAELASHVVADFALIAGNVVNRTLQAAYEYAAPTWRQWCRTGTLRDFRPSTRVQVGEFPALQALNEDAQIQYGTVGEKGEEIALLTYARGVQLSRKLFINDDLDALVRVVRSAAVAAANLESDLVYGILDSNPTMGEDATALFHADHGNLGTDLTIDVASLGAGRRLLRDQVALDGVTPINAIPRYLIVPTSLETLALQFTSQAYVANQGSAINPFAGTLQVVVEPRLTDTTTVASWYLAADYNQVDTIEVAFLEGAVGPQVAQEEDFNTLALRFRVFEDVAAKAIDYRGLVRFPFNPS